ncbi:hypothetical protein O4O00_16430 [Citrobacter sedlakii]|uniref:hypothetical protein n=1 Tax=Citrobacter sedlakii TaxID=67826 RepID=UPI0012BE0F69|nr:hypothetical protein [Citrobacter sedlakii]ECC8734507.1 hypothetical protein [Salmonella bongori]MCZ4675966.1 hypothetical protein [Citrobacter sedlakii]MDR5006021.1 hypothetical protein [Citrobacter sedlakii]
MKSNTQLKTVENETFIQRLARNVAWYAFRIARPSYVRDYSAVPVTFVCIKNRDEAAEWVRTLEMQQGTESDMPLDPEKTVPLHHVIFRG